MPHSFDINHLVIALLKLKSLQLNLTQKSKNIDAVNVEKELKVLMPHYLPLVDEIPEDQLLMVITECENGNYFNRDLIQAIKDTLQKRRQENEVAAQ